MAENKLLEFRHISKSFPGVKALDDMPSQLQDLISGALIIFAVFINQILANRRMQLENDLRDERATRLEKH